MPSKRQSQRPTKGLPSTRSRTRSSKAVLYDPAQNTQLLNQQLHALGLYAAHTIGDGNCLFRALSDQLYGTQNYHLTLREDICDWIAARPERYAPFVDDERGLDVHLRCMRTPGTYGGHLELSAFAHLKRRNVKVIQPGLVYIIEWHTGVDDASSSADDADDRDRRRIRRTKQKGDKPAASEPDEATVETIYVAYHDWEHFSSVRNISGPHNGIPNVVESSAPETSPEPSTPSKHKAKKAAKTPQRITRSSLAKAAAAEPAPSPADIPLPPSPEPRSRASSPATQLSTSSVASVSTAPSSLHPPSSPKTRVHLRLRDPSSREGRSPKRTFDESEQDDPAVPPSKPAGRKRQRQEDDDDMDWSLAGPEAEPDAGALSDTSSLSSLSDEAAFSESSLSAPPSPPRTPAKPLTRRQRKVLGLPKPRTVPVAAAGSNKIKIPGGKFRGKEGGKAASAPQSADDKVKSKGEWERNGVGRLDVRGFRELRI